MTPPRPLPDTDGHPWEHPGWADPNGPDLPELVALTCALILAGIITVTGWRKWTR